MPDLREALVARSSPLGLASVDLATGNGSALHVPDYLRDLDTVLTDLTLGKIDGARGVIVQLPPRHGKSLLSSIYLPSWYAGNFPDRHVAVTAAEVSLATTFTRASLEVVRRNADTLALQIDPGLKGATHWRARRVGDKAYKGSVRAFGVGGSIIGRGVSVLIVDDPVKNAAEAASKTSRERVWNWYTSTASTRLEPGGHVVVVMSRWSEDDLVARLLANEGRLDEGGRWHVLDMPAISDEGASLWPQRWPLEALEEKRREVGSYYFEALYQGRPSVPESGTFDVSKIERLESFERLDSLAPICATDLAYTGADERGDFTGVVVAARVIVKTKEGHYVKRIAFLEAVRIKAEDPLPDVADIVRRQPPRTVVLVETATQRDPTGRFLITSMRKALGGSNTVRRAPVSGRDKTRRAAPLIAAVAAGDIVAMPGTEALLEELAQYPSGKHDDLIDAASYAVEALLRPSKVTNL